MAMANVEDNRITLEGIKYFRGDASSTAPGHYGRKREKAFGMNYLQVENNLPAPKMDGKISSVGAFSITYERGSFLDLFGGAKIAVGPLEASGSATLEIDRSHRGSLTLVKLVIQNGELEKAFNESPKAREDFASLKGKERAVNRVLVAFDASFADDFVSASSYSVQAKGGRAGAAKIEITAHGGGYRNRTIDLSDGLVVGYLLAKPSWENNKSRIKAFNDDQWSL